MEDGRFPSLHFPDSIKALRLFTVAVVIGIARTFQRDLIRRLRSALFLRRLRFGRGRFSGHRYLAGVCTADWIYHTGQIGGGCEYFSYQLKINLT
jgi:hypothetical protein